jgi:hypothetical protein
MKVEGNQVLPSPKIISNIAKTLEEEFSNQLIVAYCESLFPEKKRLFDPLKRKPKEQTPTKRIDSNRPTLQKQRELSIGQIAALGKTQNHYYIFLIITIARQAIAIADLEAAVPSDEFQLILADLSKHRLAKVDDSHVVSISHEMAFPKSVPASLQKIYQNIDEWNLTFANEMDFENNLQKVIIRRISPRYLNIILNNTYNLLDLVRASDETKQTYNEDVLVVNINISRGKLPG